MSNFFFTNQIIDTPEFEPIKYDKHLCLDPDESRTFHKGKSFRYWNWEDCKDNTFINDEFFQDFVSKDGNLYICVNTTTTVPGTSPDWKTAVTRLAGEQGERGETGESAYEIWLRLGNIGTEQDFINSLRGPCILEWEER